MAGGGRDGVARNGGDACPEWKAWPRRRASMSVDEAGTRAEGPWSTLGALLEGRTPGFPGGG